MSVNEQLTGYSDSDKEIENVECSGDVSSGITTMGNDGAITSIKTSGGLHTSAPADGKLNQSKSIGKIKKKRNNIVKINKKVKIVDKNGKRDSTVNQNEPTFIKNDVLFDLFFLNETILESLCSKYTTKEIKSVLEKLYSIKHKTSRD